MMRICVAIVLSLVLCGCRPTPDRYILLGTEHFNLGRYDDAVIQAKKAIQQNAALPGAYTLLGRSELARKNYRDGIHAFRRAVDLAPAREDIRVEYANAALQLYRNEHVRPQFVYDIIRDQANALIAVNQDSYHGLRLRGHIAAFDQRAVDAVALFQKAGIQRPLEPDTALPLADALLVTGRPKDAEQLVEKVIGRHPDAGDGYDFLYFRYRAAGRHAEAEELLKTKVQRNPWRSDYILQLAAHYTRSGKQPQASDELQKLLSTFGTFPNAFLDVADFYARTSQPGEAVRVLEQGIRADAARKQQYENALARLYAAQGKREDALRLFNELVRSGYAESDVRRSRAMLLLASNDDALFRDGVSELERLVKEQPQDYDLRIRLGEAFLRLDDIGKAAAQLNAAIQVRRDVIPPRIALAEISRRQQNYLGVLRYADDILAIDQKHTGAKLLRCIGLSGLGWLQEAETELDRLIRAAPGYVDARLHLGQVYLGLGKRRQAESLYRQLYKAGSDLRAAEGLGSALIALGRSDEALQLWALELKRNPDSIAVRTVMARIASSAKRYDTAAEHYSWAERAAPPGIELLLELGHFERNRRDDRAALQKFIHARQLAPSDARPDWELATLYRDANQHRQAIQHYRQAAALAPDNPIILNDLAYTLSESGADLDEALRFATKAHQLQPKAPQIADTLAWIYVKKNKPDSAIQILQNITKAVVTRSAYHYHYGAALLRKGDVANAKRQLELALVRHPSEQERRDIKQMLSTIQ
jgi:tetratricopeptide (TPR) repeat protein